MKVSRKMLKISLLWIMGLYVETIVRYAILYEKKILSLSWFFFNFEVNFHHISAGPQALNYFNNGLELSYIRFWQIFIRDVLVVFLSLGSLRSFVLLLSKSVMQGM